MVYRVGWFFLGAFVVMSLVLVGCSSSTPTGPKPSTDAGDTSIISDTDAADVPDDGTLVDTDVVDSKNPPNDTDPPVQSEQVCDDEIDNDENGLTDCDDPACLATSVCSPVCNPVSVLSCGGSIQGANDGDGSTQVFGEYSCNTYLYTGPETSYSLTVDTPTFVTVTLEEESHDTDVMVLEDVDGACLSQNCVADGLSGAGFLAQPGHTYFVVVDGYEGAIGTYTLKTHCEVCVPQCTGKVCGSDGCGGSCGACVEGETCKADQSACIVVPAENTCGGALAVDGTSFYDFGDSTDALDSYSALGGGCQPAGGGGGLDVVYAFTPSSTDMFEIRLLELTFDASLYIVTDCDSASSSCLGGSELPDEESIEIGLQAGETYYIIVDGVDEEENGSFALKITSLGPCVPKCDTCNQPDGCGGTCPCDPVSNDTCASATDIGPGSLPAIVTGNTVSASDDYALPIDSCEDQPGWSFGDGAADVVYQFTPTATGPYTIALDGSESATDFDASLYVVTNCTDLVNSCVASDEIASVGGEQIQPSLTAGMTYFIIVDGYGTNQGNFTLSLSQCVPDCGSGADTKTCGGDGCGGSCGQCTGDNYCFQGQCVAKGCSGVDLNGCCDGNTLVYCLSDQLTSKDCSAGGNSGNGTCGWNLTNEWYDCGYEGADPSGSYPLQCPAL